MSLKSDLIFILTFEALFLHSNASSYQSSDWFNLQDFIKACIEHSKECLKFVEDVTLKSKEILYLIWGLIIAHPYIATLSVLVVGVVYSPEIMLAIADWIRRFKISYHELNKSFEWQKYGKYSSM
jgi:hypothetical protein